MAQWFTDNASITNLIVTRSYIGSGSTSFNKSESILYINNGLRQGINNGDFYTVTGTSNHIQGFNNGGTNISHVEGYDNNKTNSGTWAHVEGKNNTMNGASSHIEGEYNYQLSSQVGTSFMGNHTEGGYNTSTMANGCHMEGYNNSVAPTAGFPGAYHVEGINNYIGTIQSNFSHHIEGGNHTLGGALYRSNHVEGAEQVWIYGVGVHIEGRKNYLDGGTSAQGNHIEGYNNTVSPFANYAGIHICGISSSINNNIIFANNTYFISGLSLQNHYINHRAFIVGKFNSSNLSAYSNISLTGNRIYDNFTVGGGINTTTQANIFETTYIASGSNANSSVTCSVILPWVSESGDFINDTAAATGGVPLGGFYRTGNDLKIRLF